MIIDTFENMEFYEKMLPQFAEIKKFVEEFNKAPKEVGKYELDGDKLIANVQSYTSKLPENAKTEAHRMYADVQYIVSGVEEMLMAPVDTMELSEERYSQGKDVAFYKGELTTKTVLSAGKYAVLFPQDAHCPGVMHEKQEEITKIVFKVKLK